MKIIKPYHEIMFMPELQVIMGTIEKAGRTCYKSEDKITPESAEKFVRGIVKSGHHSVIEHMNITVKFICDRGVSHELVRHRLASFSQESTRYANYSKDKFGNEITVIEPFFFEKDSANYKDWFNAMQYAEMMYLNLIKNGAKAEQARSVLPNSLKTEVVMTCNLRMWRHTLKQRCHKSCHPQMREIMLPLLKEFNEKLPAVFGDIYSKYFDGGK